MNCCHIVVTAKLFYSADRVINYLYSVFAHHPPGPKEVATLESLLCLKKKKCYLDFVSLRKGTLNPLTVEVVLKNHHLFAARFLQRCLIFAKDELIRFCKDEYARP